MKISFTVKTLDSQNHTFSDVDDDSTVKSFKEKIASTVGIEANLQRLIYRGRVLNDDKKLSEYSVNGQVVHLVQRPPPTGGPDRLAASEAQARSRGPSPARNGRHHIHVHHRRGPPAVGVFPASAGQPSALVRLNISRSMINSANAVIDRLDGMSGTGANSGSGQPHGGTRQPASRQNPTGGGGGGFALMTAGIPVTQEVTMAFSGAPGSGGGVPQEVAQAIQSALNSAILGNANGQSVSIPFRVRNGQLVAATAGGSVGGDDDAGGQSRQEGDQGQEARNGDERGQQQQRGQASESGTGGQQQQQQQQQQQSGSAQGNNQQNGRQAVSHPPTRVLAEVMSLYRQAHERLAPHWDRLSEFLTDDPVVEGEVAVRDHQRLFNGVTSAMHYLSHAQHAMSDTMLNVNMAPPRHLRARPFIIQSLVQSAAVVQQMPMGLNRNATTTTTTSSSSAPAVAAAAAGGTGAASSSEVQMETEASEGEANVEVTVEPIVVGIEMTSSGPNGGNSGSGTLENMLSSIMGNIDVGNLVRSTAAAATSPSSSSSSPSPALSTGAQESRGRGNAQTQLTTSTRTRLSTQVITAPMAMGPPLGAFGSLGQPSSNFDILLPCNSHHIPGNSPGSRFNMRRAFERQRSSSVPSSANRTTAASAPEAPASATAGFRSVRGSPVRHQGVEPRQQQQQQQQQQQSEEIESSLGNLLAGLARRPAGENDDGMQTVINAIARQVFAAMSGAGGGGETISTFLGRIPDFSHAEGEDVVTDLLMSLARTLTFADLIDFLMGSDAVIGRLQEPLREFMRHRVLDPNVAEGTPEPRETEEAVLRLLDESFPDLEAVVRPANVIDGVDFAETCFQFLSLRLTELAVYVFQTPNGDFSSGFFEVLKKFLVDLTNLCLHCFSDGQASIERLLRNHLSSGIDDAAPSSITSWTMSTAIGHFRTYIAGLGEPADPATIERAVVRSSEKESRSSARRQRQEKRKATGAESADEAFETPRTSPEAMETTTVQERETEESKEIEVPSAAGTEEGFPESLLARSGMRPDTVVGREPWHRQVPSEWVPVIARDIQVQRNVPSPAPYSDAYLTTQSAKRRKLAASNKPQGDMRKVIQDTLQDAIKIAGVQPTTSKEEAAKCLAANDEVEKAASSQTRASIKRRLDQDKDYNPDNFENCKQFQEK